MHSIVGMVTGSRMSAQNIIFLDKVHVHPKQGPVSTPTMALTPALNETEEGEWSFVLLSKRKQRIKDGGHNSVKPKGRHIRKLVRTNFSRITNEVNFFFIYLSDADNIYIIGEINGRLSFYLEWSGLGFSLY